MEDEFVYLPTDLIRNTPGFAFDIGASVAKIIYRSKTDYNNGQLIGDGSTVENDHLGKMQIRKLPCDDVNGIIALIKDDCDVTKGTDIPEVIVTGNGCNRHKHGLEQELNVRMKIVSEFDMAVDGTLLTLRTDSAPFLPLAEEPQKSAEKRFKQIQEWIKSSADQSRQKWLMMQDLEETLSWKPDTSKTFPFLLVTCGSGFGFDKVLADGSFVRVDFSLFGGRSILGMLAQLTKEKDFDKLLSMASSSDGRTVDLYGSDLTDQNVADEVYSALNKDDMIMFPFGKAYEKDSVKSGDMANSVLNIVCLNLSQVAHLVAIVNDCPLVIFTGNLVTSSFMQEGITHEMTMRNLGSPVEKRVRYGFLKHGGFLTAIGALAAGAKYKILQEK